MCPDYKQVIIVRSDLKLPKGKLGAQVAHASVEAVLRSEKSVVKNWRDYGMKKVVLKVADLKELYLYRDAAHASEIVFAIITDAGLTVVEPGTVTCLAIGPDAAQRIDVITGKLKML
jgi:PTH2 family peptidyl-tRNA hydrolase